MASRLESEQSIAFAPRLPPAIIERSGLLERLESADAPLVIVRGMSGSGKSTLVAHWARQHRGAGVWVSLDPSSGYRLEFWQRVIDAIVDTKLPVVDSAFGGITAGPETAAELRALLQRGFARLPPFTLMLDDFHVVEDPQVHADLHWLLQSVSRLRVIVSTRTLSPLEQPDHVARVDTVVITPPELALSLGEVEEVAAALGADPSWAPEIYEAFSGSALLTRASLLEIASGRADSAQDAIDSLNAIGIQLPFDLQAGSEFTSFLLRASVAERLTPSLAAIFGEDATLSHLATLESDGFGSWSRRARGDEFTIHPYLRDRLSAILATELPLEIPRLRLAYAQDRIEHDDPIAAARQFALLGDLDGIVRVLRLFFGDLVRLHLDAIVDLLRSLEPAQLRKHPELIAMLLLDANRTPGSSRLGILQLATLGIAGAQARLGRDDAVNRVPILMTLLAGQRLSGNYDQARRTADLIAQAIDALDDRDRDAVRGLLGQALTHVGTTFFYSGNLSRASSAYREASLVARRIDRPWVELHADSMHSLVDAVRGDLPAALSRISLARERRTPQGWKGTYPAAGYHLAEAFLALENFDSRGAIEQIGALAAHEATIEHWPLMAQLRALAALADGNPALGLDRLEQDIAAHSTRPPTSLTMTVALESTRVDLLLADRQSHRAEKLLRTSAHHPVIELARSRLELATGRYAQALERATKTIRSDHSSIRDSATALLTVAVAAHHLHQDDTARDAARRATDLLDATHLRLPLILFPHSDLLALFDSAGLDTAGLLRSVPDVSPHPVGRWQLTPAEFRVLGALSDNPSVDGLAAELRLSGNTVKTHLRRLYRKLGVRSREEALAVAALNGMVEGQRSTTDEY
jgi:LuxR family maltose regulon positive regulatory protein